ncbi:hypothetical protein GCM10010123_23600 [Pilimelia anulata]|uniref:Uncharacterized protein n=1 Tax=Pilimelia anulata TaxID=53371 RepID=A0A8J3B778_9ACTN|nr:hypothetical protein GCM10010123_23600 [Pilimelia anulata]
MLVASVGAAPDPAMADATGCRPGERNSGRILDVKVEKDPVERRHVMRLIGWVRHCAPRGNYPTDAFGVIQRLDPSYEITQLEGPLYEAAPMVRDYAGVRIPPYDGMSLVCLISEDTAVDCWRVRANPEDPYEGPPTVLGRTPPPSFLPGRVEPPFGRCGTCW